MFLYVCCENVVHHVFLYVRFLSLIQMLENVSLLEDFEGFGCMMVLEHGFVQVTQGQLITAVYQE